MLDEDEYEAVREREFEHGLDDELNKMFSDKDNRITTEA